MFLDAPPIDPPLPAEVRRYQPIIVREWQYRFGKPAPLAAAVAQMHQESGFNPDAKSRVGALGLQQFMPSTARWVGDQIGPGVATDPQWAIRAGAWYMRYLYDSVKYATDCDRYGAALSAYNGGLGWHNKRQARASEPLNFWSSVRTINPGILDSNQRENEQYSQRIVYTLQPRYRAMGGRLVCL